MQKTAAGASTSAGRDRGRTKKAGRGGRGPGRGRKAATPSSPPPSADSPDHRTAPSEMKPPEVDPSRTLLHEPRADEPSPHETLAPEAPSHETLDQAMSQLNRLGEWLESSGHADGGEGGNSAIVRASGLRGAMSTSVVVQSSRPPRRPLTSGG